MFTVSPALGVGTPGEAHVVLRIGAAGGLREPLESRSQAKEPQNH